MKHLKTTLLVVSVLLTAALSAPAQEKKMEMPKPGPEVKKLAYFVGTWTTEGELKENPFGMPAGKMTSTDKCEWFTGGYSVVCHSTGKGPMGAMHGIGILGYNTEDKVYTYYGVDNSGYAGLSKGKIDGNFWVFTSDEKMGERPSTAAIRWTRRLRTPTRSSTRPPRTARSGRPSCKARPPRPQPRERKPRRRRSLR